MGLIVAEDRALRIRMRLAMNGFVTEALLECWVCLYPDHKRSGSVTAQCEVDSCVRRGGMPLVALTICATLLGVIASRANPVIVSHPSSQTAIVGSSTTLSVEATSSEPLAFEWFKDGSSIAGATDSLLRISNTQLTDGGAYRVDISDGIGTVSSDVATLTVVLPVEITRHPESLAKIGGDTAVFSVSGKGVSALSFQWFKDGILIPSATSSVLQLPNLQSSDGGFYHVVVSNEFGSALSESAWLTVTVPDTPDFITAHPTDRTVKLGGRLVLTVRASSREALSYQWLRDRTAIPGQTSPTLSIDSTRASDEGSYSVVVLTPSAAQLSDPATVTIDPAIAPLITIQPSNQTNLVGGSVSFFVGALGPPPLSYQWLRNGSPIESADKTNYIISVLQPTHSGAYSVLVTNLIGKTTSSSARLTVLLPPSIRSHPANQAVLVGNSASLFADATGTLPLEFIWIRNGEILAGATNRILTLRNIQEADAGEYRAEVKNPYGSAVTSNVVLTVNLPATIVKQPVSQSVFENTQTMFDVEATGTPPLTYQWARNGVTLRNATNSFLDLVSVSTNEAGRYRATVRNSFRRVVSSEATLNVKPALQITRQVQSTNIFEGSDITLFIEVSGARPMGFQWIKDDQLIPGATDASLRFSPAIVSDSGIYSLLVSNALTKTFTSNATLSVQVPAAIIEQPVSRLALAGDDVMFRVAAKGDTPVSYSWFRMGTNLLVATNTVLTLTNVQFQDSADFHVVVSNAFSTVVSSNVSLKVDPRPIILKQPVGQRVILGNDLVFTTESGGRPPFDYQWLKDDVVIPGATNVFLPITGVRASDAGSYRAVVAGFGGSAATIEAVLEVILPLVIKFQPVSQTVLVGEDVALAVEATSIASLTYQWFKNGDVIENATNSSLSLPEVSEMTAGNYSVRLQNEFGDLTSSMATVRVVFPKTVRGDFDGDGLPEIVFEDSNGFLAAWFMNGTDLRFPSFFKPNNIGNLDWKPVGSGDFDLDGNEDLLFQRNDGALAVWQLNGLTLTSVVSFPVNPVQGEEWTVAATADFNRDGKIDIVLQKRNGTLVIWYLNRVELDGGSLVNPTHPDDLEWKVVGAADVNRDENVDLVFQHTDGSLAVWYLNGISLASASLLNPSHPGDSKWRVVSVADRNNDGKPDLLFQHQESGDLGVWFMNRNVLMEASLLNPFETGNDWKVVAP